MKTIKETVIDFVMIPISNSVTNSVEGSVMFPVYYSVMIPVSDSVTNSVESSVESYSKEKLK